MAFLRTVRLEQRAGGKVLLSDINLEINRGEVFVVIGPTGAGKTTLMRLLDLLDKPYSGDIYLDGAKVTNGGASLMHVRRRMAIVFQKPLVFNDSVFNNVAYPLKIRGAASKTVGQQVEKMLQATGLSGYARRKARTLSGGEAQRVALARALVTEPEVLLLDEPTANLDPTSVNLIESLVVEFNRLRGLTIVMATHDMQQGQRLAQRAGVLMDGQLVQVGRPVDIFYSPDNIRVAGLIGIHNIMRGKIASSEAGLASVDIGGRVIEVVTDLSAGSAVDVYIRPEDIILTQTAGTGSARNTLSCIIKSLKLTGSLCTVELDCGFHIEALVTVKSAEEMGLKQGQSIYASFKATAVRVLPAA